MSSDHLNLKQMDGLIIYTYTHTYTYTKRSYEYIHTHEGNFIRCNLCAYTLPRSHTRRIIVHMLVYTFAYTCIL